MPLGYEFTAAIGSGATLRTILGDDMVIELPQGYALVPLERGGDFEGTRAGHFYWLTDSLTERLIDASRRAPIAYVEADFFGGTGTQSAIAWDNGAIVLEPLHTQSVGHDQAGFEPAEDLATTGPSAAWRRGGRSSRRVRGTGAWTLPRDERLGSP